ncbi:MAG: tRNA (adenosine(37)-N6)-threonylcarbamoyltransferase complex ATPase subunit type 1 TsaE [Gammaproteobacteria bacterium]|jgi:tRNA threonylcarbamoyladenosine biosynthesis protein TsaE
MDKMLENEQQTLALGQMIGENSHDLHVIYLNGLLGAGKTTLTRGILRGLGYTQTVKSPTYTLVETYELAARTIHHFDLYRMSDIHELEDVGFRDYFTDEALCIIEWPERAAILPQADLICDLKIIDHHRKIILSANTQAGHELIARTSKC